MKERYIALAVTTIEALDACFDEQALLFCVENPVYSAVRDRIRNRKEAIDYVIVEDKEKQIMLFKKVAGEKQFDDERYEPLYLPLSWENWHS